ncbi:MAG: flagellar hook-associated protein FlgK [Alphaproteobacteria bacterium]
MGLSSLDAALTGLRASQKQISVISNNVANVNTPGYSRKILPQSAQSLNGETVGVATGIITRNVDLNLERDLWTQISAVGGLEVRQSYLQRIEKFHGPPDAELSVAAEISRLHDAFAALSDTPEDSFLLSQTVLQAEDTAQKINELGNLILQSRNDVQDDMDTTITRANQLLSQIAELNDTIQDNQNISRSTALAEDQRDEAIKELADLIDISFFKRGDGVLVVQTTQGVELANTTAKELYFSPSPLSASAYYPEGAAPVYVVDQGFAGDPETSVSAINITESDLGGRLGGLIELRDADFPRQMAQIDELAHKMATRFEAQGLMLFTDPSGNVPADTPPDPNAGPPPTPVEYVGFSTQIRVNSAIQADNSLIQQGTYSATNIQEGSSEVIRRVLEFTFGATDYQQAFNGDPATQVDIALTGTNDLQTWLGLDSSTIITGANDLSAYPNVGALVTTAGGDLDPGNDTFRLTFEEPRIPLGPVSIDISLANAALQPGATAVDQIAAEIDAQIALAALPAGLTADASVGTNGELILTSNGSVTLDASAPPNAMGATGISYLGLSENTFAPQDPYFDVQVGQADPVRITIEPGDFTADLLTKLQAVPNLAARVDANGNLQLRPGDDDTFTDQSFGGDLKIIGGPFTTNGAAYSDTAAPGTRINIDDDINIASALFGTYSISGGVVQNDSPVTTISYQSQISASTTNTVAFRQDFLGPGANISTGVIGSSRLIDYAQKMVNQHASELVTTENRIADEESLRDLLQTQLYNDSGVNLDEELSNLVLYQTAFSASARVVTAVDEMFQELLSAF